MNYRALLAASAIALSAGTAFAASGFLTDYSKLQPVTTATGTDLVYGAPDAAKRMVAYTSVMIDQPEIHFSADSEYKGLKPEDIEALSTVMRDALKSRLEAGRYKVVEKPAADVLFVRTALTELYLKKKKRRLMAYTPVGAVTKVGIDALKETLDKVDIIEMALEAEIADSKSSEVLAAIVVKRGARKAEGQKEQRMDMDEFRATVGEYGSRLRCRLDNAKLPEAQWIDCTDPKAREAREGKAS
ncbi:MAG TPA: DUF3313 domain-containing protein [Steroidobacteraceae bacterium]